MSEEAQENNEQAPVEEVVENPVSEVEVSARESGWTPQEDWDGDPADWKPAKAFVEKGEMIGSLRDLKRSNKELAQQVEALVNYNRTIEDRTKQQTIEHYKNARREAIETGDVEQAEAISDQISQAQVQQSQPPLTEYDQKALHFTQKHSEWFNKNSPENVSMVAFALATERDIKVNSPGISPDDLYKTVEKKIESQYPHRFSNENQALSQPMIKPSSGSRNAPAGQRSSNKGASALNEEQKKIFQAFKKTIPGYTIDKYVKELKNLGEL